MGAKSGEEGGGKEKRGNPCWEIKPEKQKKARAKIGRKCSDP